jgi:hypothetical protein
MAITMRMHWDGVTPDQYDRVRDLVGWERDRAAGGILHQAWFVGDQLNVCDVWESAEDFNAFVEHRLMPGVADAGVVGQPEVQILPLYNCQLAEAPGAGAVVDEDEIPFEPYQAIEAKVGWRQVPPIGGVSHIAAVDGDMARLVSVWQSQAALDAFNADRIGPAAAELGIPAPDEQGPLHPLHALFDSAGVLSDH